MISESSCSDTSIIFECSDIRRDIGLLLLKGKDPNKFEIHLYNDYTSDAIAMVLSIKDLTKMFDCLEDYFLKANRCI
jgi:hypothetical protein